MSSFDENEEIRKSMEAQFLKDEVMITLNNLSPQSSEEGEHSTHNFNEFSHAPFVSPLESDRAVGIYETSTPYVDESVRNKSSNVGNSENESLQSNDQHTPMKNEDKSTTFNSNPNLTDKRKYLTKNHFFRNHVKEKIIISLGIILIVLLLVWNSMIAWLIKTIYSYPHQTFGWKIVLGLLFMWTTSVSSGCTFFTKEVILNPNDHCVQRESYVNCPYEVQFSGAMGTFLFFLIISSFFALLSLLFLIFRKIRQSCGSVGQCFIRNAIILSCWISLWLLLPFVMNFYTLFSKLESEMKETIKEMSPPVFIPLWWNQTQTHSKCCGVKSYEDWEVRNETYPISCCNALQNSCETFPTSDQVWLNGCYDEESNRLQFFGGLFIAFWTLKIVSEFFLFCTLCKVFESYTTPVERRLTSSFNVNGYQIKAYGNCIIHSVPNRHQIIIEVKMDVHEDCKIKTKQSRRVVSICTQQKEKRTGYVEIRALTRQHAESIVIGECYSLNYFAINI